MEPESFLMAELKIKERLIVPTILFHRHNVENDLEQPVRIELEGIGARVITCPFDFHQDIFEANPKDIQFEHIVSELSEQGETELFAEVAFIRSLEKIRCEIDICHDRSAYVARIKITFRKSPVKIVGLFTSDEEVSELMCRYFTSYR